MKFTGMKLVCSVLAAAGMAVVGANADDIAWGNVITLEPVYNQDGSGNPLDGSSYLITLWEDGADGIIQDYNDPGSDDFRVGTLTGGDFFSGLFSVQFTEATEGTLPGERIYTQVFNAPTIGAASWFVVLDPAGFTITTPDPPATLDYDPSGSAVNGSDWQPIPEPATLALLGIGLTGIASRRMRKK